MSNLDKCAKIPAGSGLDLRALSAAERMADKWEHIVMRGHYAGALIMRMEELVALRDWAGVEANEQAMFRHTPVIGAAPGEIHQFGTIVIARSEDMSAVAERLVGAPSTFRIAELREGDCWLVAHEGPGVPQAG